MQSRYETGRRFGRFDAGISEREIAERDKKSAGAIAKFLKKIADGIKRMLDNLPKGTGNMTSRETEVLVSSATNMVNIAKAWANMVNEVRKNGPMQGTGDSKQNSVRNASANELMSKVADGKATVEQRQELRGSLLMKARGAGYNSPVLLRGSRKHGITNAMGVYRNAYTWMSLDPYTAATYAMQYAGSNAAELKSLGKQSELHPVIRDMNATKTAQRKGDIDTLLKLGEKYGINGTVIDSETAFKEAKKIVRDFYNTDTISQNDEDIALDVLESIKRGDAQSAIASASKLENKSVSDGLRSLLDGTNIQTDDGIVSLDEYADSVYKAETKESNGELRHNDENSGVSEYVCRIGDNPLVIDAGRFQGMDDVRDFFDAVRKGIVKGIDIAEAEGLRDKYIGESWPDMLAYYAKDNGFTSLQIKNISDLWVIKEAGEVRFTDNYAFFNEEDIRSIDLVTYDDNGKIIPYEERFVSDRNGEESYKNKDFRYSTRRIIGNDGHDYGVGVYLDSTLLDNLSEKEQREILKEHIKLLGGHSFTAFDNDGYEHQIRIAKHDEKYTKKDKNGSISREFVNNDLVRRAVSFPQKRSVLANIEEILVTAKFDSKEAAMHSHDWLDDSGKTDWDKWYTYVQEKNGNVWKVNLRIANANTGDAILYDVLPIENVEGSGKTDAQSTENILPATGQTVKPSNQNSVRFNIVKKDAKRIRIETNKPIQASIRQRGSIRSRTMEFVQTLVESGKISEEQAKQFETVGNKVDELCRLIEKDYFGKMDKNGMPLLPEDAKDVKLSNNIFSNSSYSKDA